MKESKFANNLGLLICQKILSKDDGSISVSNQNGSIIKFTMKMRLRNAYSFQREGSNSVVNQSLQSQDSFGHMIEAKSLKSEKLEDRRPRKASATQVNKKGSRLPRNRKKNKK